MKPLVTLCPSLTCDRTELAFNHSCGLYGSGKSRVTLEVRRDYYGILTEFSVELSYRQ